MIRALVTAACVSAVLATPATPAAAAPGAQARRPADAPVARLAVTGYALGSLPSAVVRRNAHALTAIGVAGVSIHSDGAHVARPNADLDRLRRVAHANQLSASLLVSNWSNRLGQFDSHALGLLLRSAAHRRAVASRLGQIVRHDGWDGVTVDLEALERSWAPGLTAFVARLRSSLPDRATVDIDVSATARYRSRGYDLRGIARSVDHVALMAYDQHGPGWSDAGPVGALPWQRRCLDAALRLVPARQIDLGVAGYGYLWRPDGSGRTVLPRGARDLVSADGAVARWHPKAGEWSATLSNGARLWWSDARSWRQRVRLAQHRGLHGLALWRLGSADPLH
jgi:spore germination protein YaaH